MKLFRRITVLPLLLAVWVSACSGPLADNPDTAAAAANSARDEERLDLDTVPVAAGEVSVETKSDPTISPDPEIQRLVERAKADLATNLSIDNQVIETLQAEFVTWRDSSAGCPEPGMQYLQVLTSGARIVLKYNDARYYYHSSGDRPPTLCKNPSPNGPLPHEDGEI